MFDKTEQLKNKKKRIEEQKSFMNEINLIDTFYQSIDEQQLDEISDIDPEWVRKFKAGELDEENPI